MKSLITIRSVDKGWKALQARVKALKTSGAHVRVGVLADGEKNSRPGDPLNNAELAVIHEFGSPAAGVPERSFMRSTFAANKIDYLKRLRDGLVPVVEGKVPVAQMLGRLGVKMVSDMRNTIRAGIAPANAPSTVARKGSSTPLVDTGQLVQAITWQVKDK